MKRRAKQLLSAVLCLAMTLSLTGSAVFAGGHVHDASCGYSEGSPCTHTEHDDDCGYAEAVSAADCTHTHDANCGYAAALEGQPCTHAHDETCGYAPALEEVPCDCGGSDGVHAAECSWRPASPGVPCQHTHDGNCGYVAPKEESPCTHIHDGNCGYREAAEGSPCKHELGQHDESCGYAEPSPCNYVEKTYKYAVIYHRVDDVVYDSESTEYITDTTREFTVDACSFENPGFEFLGWGLSPEDSQPVYQPGGRVVLTSLIADASGNVTLHLYALWKAEEPPVEQTFGVAPIARYYKSEDYSGEGTPYFDKEFSEITVGSKGVTVSADAYAETIFAEGRTYRRRGLMTAGGVPSESLSIPAYPQTEGADRDAWMSAWSDGFSVVYVLQEPEQNQYGYIISYHRNNGTDETAADGPYTTADTTREFAAWEIPGGWEDGSFLGWGLKPDDTEPTYRPGDNIVLHSLLADSTGAVSLDLYAIWKAEEPREYSYLISYHSNNDTDEVTTDGPYVATDTTREFKAGKCLFRWEDNSFLGWGLKPDDTMPAYQPGDKIILHSLSADSTGAVSLDLYAIWKTGDLPVETTYTVTVKGAFTDGSTPSGAGKYKEKENVFLWPGTRSWDYEFSHWSILRTDNGTQIAELKGPSSVYIMPAFDITAVANWNYVGEPELKLVPDKTVEIIEVKDNEVPITFQPDSPLPGGTDLDIVPGSATVGNVQLLLKDWPSEPDFTEAEIISVPEENIYRITGKTYTHTDYKVYYVGSFITIDQKEYLIDSIKKDYIVLYSVEKGDRYLYYHHTGKLVAKQGASISVIKMCKPVIINGSSYIVYCSQKGDTDTMYFCTPDGRIAGKYSIGESGNIKRVYFYDTTAEEATQPADSQTSGGTAADDAQLSGSGSLADDVQLSGSGSLADDAQLSGSGSLADDAQLSGSGSLADGAQLSGSGSLADDAQLSGQFMGTVSAGGESGTQSQKTYGLFAPFAADISLSSGLNTSGVLTMDVTDLAKQYPEGTVFMAAHYTDGTVQMDTATQSMLNSGMDLFTIADAASESAQFSVSGGSGIEGTDESLLLHNKFLNIDYLGNRNYLEISLNAFSPFVVYAFVPLDNDSL